MKYYIKTKWLQKVLKSTEHSQPKVKCFPVVYLAPFTVHKLKGPLQNVLILTSLSTVR